MDVLGDPRASRGAKAGAIALVAIGGIAVVAKAAIDVIGQDRLMG